MIINLEKKLPPTLTFGQEDEKKGKKKKESPLEILLSEIQNNQREMNKKLD